MRKILHFHLESARSNSSKNKEKPIKKLKPMKKEPVLVRKLGPTEPVIVRGHILTRIRRNPLRN